MIITEEQKALIESEALSLYQNTLKDDPCFNGGKFTSATVEGAIFSINQDCTSIKARPKFWYAGTDENELWIKIS